MTSAFFSVAFIFSILLAQPVSGAKKEKPLDREFEIKVGETISIRNEGLKITFTNVAEDSRCPQGVTCIWAGNGKVVLKLGKARRRSNTISLNTTLDPKHDVYQGYEVKLVSLAPYPKKDVAIKKKEYVATLVVSRKQG